MDPKNQVMPAINIVIPMIGLQRKGINVLYNLFARFILQVKRLVATM